MWEVPMTITLVRTGGLAGLVKRAPTAINTDSLPASDAEDFLRKVHEALSNPPSASSESSPVRDEMAYTITIEENGARNVLVGTDRSTTPAFQALRELLERHASRT